MTDRKYFLKCTKCGAITPDFAQWFAQDQICPKCSSKHSEVWYNSNYKELPLIFEGHPDSFWQYFDFLPLTHRENIISRGEGAVPVETWPFLEDFAKVKYGINCKVAVYRNDLNGGTGTFKDVAASLAASVLKENGINQYTVVSTGNTATSFSRYLAIAGISCSVFIPENALKSSEAYISAYGQKVFRVKGDYAKTKIIAADFAKKNNILISSGNIDPLRVEAKKTMVFEWLRQMGKLPDVYIQAISGGTGPIAIDKGVREIREEFPDAKNPRFIMVQPDKCDPMVQAWEKAEKKGFQMGFENDYPIIDNPATTVPTLATGNPATYPIVAKLVKETGGSFIRINEAKLTDYSKLISFERKIILGPASAVCFAGFFKALKEGFIKNGETVMINAGEGVKRAPEFVNQMIYTTQIIENAEECIPHDINKYRKMLWEAIPE